MDSHLELLTYLDPALEKESTINTQLQLDSHLRTSMADVIGVDEKRMVYPENLFGHPPLNHSQSKFLIPKSSDFSTVEQEKDIECMDEGGTVDAHSLELSHHLLFLFPGSLTLVVDDEEDVKESLPVKM
jgi:hypothetical protein